MTPAALLDDIADGVPGAMYHYDPEYRWLVAMSREALAWRAWSGRQRCHVAKKAVVEARAESERLMAEIQPQGG